jgi:hypothetical protein
MECFNCGKTIPDGAKRCQYCESDLNTQIEMTPEVVEAASDALEQVMPGGMDHLREMAQKYDTAEEFANAIFVGACPSCESADVGTFEEVKGVEDPTVARCFACDHIWCTECIGPLDDPKKNCGHWAVCDACGKEADCPYLGNSCGCPKIAGWLAGGQGASEEN